MGNAVSVQKALKFLNIPNIISANPEDLREANVIILPGVGSFQKGIHNLHEMGFFEVIREEVLVNKKPFLGFCLGMQLLATKGYENGPTPGLNLIKGEVKRIESKKKRIPHMGWNTIETIKEGHFQGIASKDYYFVHSYHFVPEKKQVIVATVDYELNLVACIQKGNIFATQFHPEKSQQAGLSMIRNFYNCHA